MNKCDVSHSANAQPFEEEFFLLLMRINRVLRQLANQQMEICSLTPTQLFFLKRLYEAGAPAANQLLRRWGLFQSFQRYADDRPLAGRRICRASEESERPPQRDWSN